MPSPPAYGAPSAPAVKRLTELRRRDVALEIVLHPSAYNGATQRVEGGFHAALSAAGCSCRPGRTAVTPDGGGPWAPEGTGAGALHHLQHGRRDHRRASARLLRCAGH